MTRFEFNYCFCFKSPLNVSVILIKQYIIFVWWFPFVIKPITITSILFNTCNILIYVQKKLMLSTKPTSYIQQLKIEFKLLRPNFSVNRNFVLHLRLQMKCIGYKFYKFNFKKLLTWISIHTDDFTISLRIPLKQ